MVHKVFSVVPLANSPAFICRGEVTVGFHQQLFDSPISETEGAGRASPGEPSPRQSRGCPCRMAVLTGLCFLPCIFVGGERSDPLGSERQQLSGHV